VEDDRSEEPVDSLLAAVARIPIQPQSWSPPTEFDEYRLLRPLGRGGMGSVWLAEDRQLSRHVAIKFIAHDEPDETTRERFAIEARAAAQLTHVNVVTVHRFGEVAGRPYLVSEYIRGEPLDKLAKPIPWERALALGITLARGLAAAHRAGIVHRDIKPGNAILTADGEAKLVDFGLAKLDHADLRVQASAMHDHSPLTQQGAIAGTPRYLAPETRAGEPADRRSDVYQIGCILYELVTGRAPLLDILDRQAVTATVQASQRDRPGELDASSVGDRIGTSGAAGRFAAVVDRCLRRDPQQRFASGDELREALERLAAPVVGGDLPEGNPYRGLVAFDAEHRALFFGRGPDIRAVIEQLRERAFVLVAGDSGVGKSSLVRAGVLPHIASGAMGDKLEWSTIQLVPGQRPLSSLASLLAPRLSLDEAALVAVMRDQPAELLRKLRREHGTKRALAIFVDQFEELVTIADTDEANHFAAVLARLATGTQGVRVIATVRSDFVTRVAELPGIGTEVGRALFLLRPLTEEGAREAIVGPARAKNVRFESDELVEILVSAGTNRADAARGRQAIELPLLAFTLAQLWDARDQATQTITTRSLEAIGGVRGALARHADGVIDSLVPSQRDAARRLLLRLVTPERTRARRTAEDLGDRAVLDALVRGRLLVARGEEPPTFELAHERLIDGWPTLAGWLTDANEALVVHARLSTTVADWERLGRRKEALWRGRQLADLAILPAETLAPGESEFVTQSRRADRRRRLAWRAIAVAIPVVAVGVYAGARLVTRRDVARHVAENVGVAERELQSARTADTESKQLAASAFAKFDRDDLDGGERDWAASLSRANDARAAYARGSRALEAAFLLDTDRDYVRAMLAKTTHERLLLAERSHRDEEREELAARLPLYSPSLARQGTSHAQLELAITPAASVTLSTPAGETPLPPTLAPGSHVLIARAPEHATVRIPLVLSAGERRKIELALPRASAVPAGFQYIPAGTFSYGSRDDERGRGFLGTAPMHAVSTGAYLIATTETTYAEWIAFLNALPEDEREKRRPKFEVGAKDTESIELQRVEGTWELVIIPTSVAYSARAGKPIVYRERDAAREQDWLRMPVSGISFEDALAYTAWLDRTGRVPRARVCHEFEWERAARGADGRSYPHGNTIAPAEANYDLTYGRREGGFGPDVVGSHPASTSVFGLVDTSGNVWEMVRGALATKVAMRGGCYINAPRAIHLANRAIITPASRHVHIGIRVCADPPP
jgi:formylglycine-generating enzyme required for sulfatase activity/predicted Ser/Thr protein kinase